MHIQGYIILSSFYPYMTRELCHPALCIFLRPAFADAETCRRSVRRNAVILGGSHRLRIRLTV